MSQLVDTWCVQRGQDSKDQSVLKKYISPVITEISQQGSPYFLIARAYPFFPKNAEQFVPGPRCWGWYPTKSCGGKGSGAKRPKLNAGVWCLHTLCIVPRV